MENTTSRSSDELLRLIFDYIGRVSRERSLDNVLILLSDMARRLINAQRCTLWLHDVPNKELWSKVAHGTDAIRIPEHSGLAGHTLATGESLIINDPYHDTRFNSDVDKRTGFVTESILLEPILGEEGRVIGAFQGINKAGGGGFTEDDRSLLRLAAVYSSGSLQNAELNDEIEATQREIILMLGEVGESRSKETGNHVRRVTEYCALLAQAMGLPARDVALLRAASPLHDIGKVSIPDSILNKPGKLTDEEYLFMQSHTSVGYHLLATSKRSLVSAAATIAHEHHERHDGRGYPRGVSGEDIHVFGRITAVADVFDALASDRCYKKAWPLERVFGLLRDEAGKQFDPRCIEAFFACKDNILAVRDAHMDYAEVHEKTLQDV